MAVEIAARLSVFRISEERVGLLVTCNTDACDQEDIRDFFCVMASEAFVLRCISSSIRP